MPGFTRFPCGLCVPEEIDVVAYGRRYRVEVVMDGEDVEGLTTHQNGAASGRGLVKQIRDV